MNRKSQITIIIIIAVFILLVFSVSLYLFVTGEERVFIPHIKKVVGEAKPVSDYVTACLKSTTEDALALLGSQGGFLDVSNLRTDAVNPTSGEAVVVGAEDAMRIPYWFHLASENECEKTGVCRFVLQVPSQTGIVQELEAFVAENIDDCLKNFEDLKGFQITPEGEKAVDIYITGDSVKAVLKYPLKIAAGTSIFSTEEYLAEVNLNLKKILKLGEGLAELEMKNGFLETHTLNLLSVYSDIDEDKLPPFGKTDIGFKGRIWVKSSLKDKIKSELLAPNMQFLRVAYFNEKSGESRLQSLKLDAPLEEMDDKTVDVFLNRGMIIPMKEDYTDLHTTFSYQPWWDVYFDLNCDEELCSPQEAAVNYLAVFGIQRYQFAYDLSYPVLVEIAQPDALDSKGYIFRFLLEANIRNNERLEADTELLPSYDTISASTMLCDQQTSGEHIINVKNGALHSEEDVDGAVVNFVCGYEKCRIGEIEDNGLRARLPRCLNGRLEVSKNGFHPAVISLNTFTDSKQTLDLKLEPYRIVEVDVRKYPLSKTGEHGPWLAGAVPIQLGDREEGVITITKKIKPGEQGYSAVASIVGNKETTANPCNGGQKKDIKNIELIPGDYEVLILILSHDNVAIPAERREAGSWPFTEKYTVPGMEFGCGNPMPVGQIKFGWTVNARELDAGSKIEFFGIAADFSGLPENYRKIEDLGVLGETQRFADMYKSYIKPVWRK